MNLDSFDRSDRLEFIRSPLQERNLGETANGRIGFLTVWASILGFSSLFNDENPISPPDDQFYLVARYTGDVLLRDQFGNLESQEFAWTYDFLRPYAPGFLPQSGHFDPRFTETVNTATNPDQHFIQLSPAWRVEAEYPDPSSSRLTTTFKAYDRISGELRAEGSETVELESPITPDQLRATIATRAAELWTGQQEPTLIFQTIDGRTYYSATYENLAQSTFEPNRSYVCDQFGELVGATLPVNSPGIPVCQKKRAAFSQYIPDSSESLELSAFVRGLINRSRIVVCRGRVPNSRTEAKLVRSAIIATTDNQFTELNCARLSTPFPKFTELTIPTESFPSPSPTSTLRTVQNALFWTTTRPDEFFGNVTTLPPETVNVPHSC